MCEGFFFVFVFLFFYFIFGPQLSLLCYENNLLLGKASSFLHVPRGRLA